MSNLKNYVKDNRDGTIVELIKNKPYNPARGHATVQLINSDGTVDVEAKTENVISGHLARAAYSQALWHAPTKGDYTQAPNPFEYIYLTDWDEPEHPDTPTVLGNHIGYAVRSETYSGSSTTRGTINTAESQYYVNSQGQYVMKMVFDWPTHAANGQFNTIWWAGQSAGYSLGYGNRQSVTPGDFPSSIRNHFGVMHNAYQMKFDYETGWCEFISTYNGYCKVKVNWWTGEKEDPIVLRDQDGGTTNKNGYYCEIFGHNTNGKVHGVYVSRYTSSSSSSGMSPYSLTFYTWNADGTLSSKVTKHRDTYKDVNEAIMYMREYNHNCMFFRNNYWYVLGYRTVDGTTRRFIARIDPETGEIVAEHSLDSVLYYPISNPNGYTVSAVHVGNTMIRLALSNGSNTYTYNYILNDYKGLNLHDLKYAGNASPNGSGIYYEQQTINNDHWLIWTNSNMWNTNSNRFMLGNYWGSMSAQTLLAAPIRKTQSHTMKITYEFIIDPEETYTIRNWADSRLLPSI